MLKIYNFVWIALLSTFLHGQKSNIPTLKTGFWTGNLQLNTTTSLPFKVELIKNRSGYSFIIHNGKETILLDKVNKINDSLQIEFPDFNSKLILKEKGKKKLNGYWLNLNKGVNYKIPCVITAGYSTRFKSDKLTKNAAPSLYNGRWESTFEPSTPDAYKAVGMFSQQCSLVDGTFLTETGDYRFLEGNVAGDSIYLSCFDGSHAFLFTGLMSNNTIDGTFYSGKHWQTKWEAFRNEDFELTDPDSLTLVVNDSPLVFNLKDLSGNAYNYPNDHYKNKVTIIQIMGTWCPNCMDETRYFKELYSKYNDKGLEIIAIGYEVGNSFEEHAARISTLQERLDLKFTFLVGGTANKGLASEHFKMLNHIISFPTSIIIGKDGTIRRIHTGFNGPGTGQYYLDYIAETDAFIQHLLNE